MPVEHKPGQLYSYKARLSVAIKAIDSADKALKSGDKKTALEELSRARKLMVSVLEGLGGSKASPIVNTKCPIMGTRLDPVKVPYRLTRLYKGKRIGFCCGGCPAAWDNLSDAQKQVKLKEALSGAKHPGEASPAKHEQSHQDDAQRR